jgi:mono/diheme cytochrome c family protein
MRLKTLGVFLVLSLSMFTMLYWLTDGIRRDAIAVEQEDDLLHFGEIIFSDDEAEAAAAGCAQCHGAEGEGGDADSRVIGPSLRTASLAGKVAAYQTETGLNYLETVVRRGGVAVSGNPRSQMPAWENTLNRQQIDAVVVLIETWLEDVEEAEDVEDTVEAGQQVFASVGCVTCHGAELEGGVGPALTNVGNEVGNLPQEVSQQDQYVADYEEDPRAALELWIRDSAGNYNDGTATGMPPHPESAVNESQLRALVTFLLSQTGE